MPNETLSACILGRWGATIGDPHLMGWLTVVLFALVAVLALAVLRRRGGAGARGFWIVIAATMAFLAVNKQLDLQSALTAAGRCIALAQGWYDDRRPVQIAFVAALLAAAPVVLWLAARMLRGRLRAHGVALVGLVFVCAFVLVRAIGFHGTDALIDLRWHGVRMNWVLEWTGPLLIAANALWLLRRCPGSTGQTRS